MVLKTGGNLGYTKGKYITICEGEEYWTDPVKLQKQEDFLEAIKDYVITYGCIEVFMKMVQ